MRILMDDNQVHNDVINKLWQVYGKSPTPSSWCVVIQMMRSRFRPTFGETSEKRCRYHPGHACSRSQERGS